MLELSQVRGICDVVLYKSLEIFKAPEKRNQEIPHLLAVDYKRTLLVLILYTMYYR